MPRRTKRTEHGPAVATVTFDTLIAEGTEVWRYEIAWEGATSSFSLPVYGYNDKLHLVCGGAVVDESLALDPDDDSEIGAWLLEEIHSKGALVGAHEFCYPWDDVPLYTIQRYMGQYLVLGTPETYDQGPYPSLEEARREVNFDSVHGWTTKIWDVERGVVYEREEKEG